MVNQLKSFIALPSFFWRRLRKDSDVSLSRSILTLLLIAETMVCFLWIYTLSGLGEGYAFMASIPYLYIVISYVSLFIFYRFEKYEYFVFIQLLMLLVMPFFMQWAIGGFIASSGMAIWSILSPVGALMILRSKQSTPWFILFLGLVLLSWVFDAQFAANALPLPAITRNLLFVINLTGVASIIYIVTRYFQSQKQLVMDDLAEERQRSDRLLLNILPEKIAQRLKQNDLMIAEAFDEATILFADLIDFTTISAQMPPSHLISFLNQIFSAFDQLAEKYGVEKIKTIGDAYMVVGGVPEKTDKHASAIALLALEMVKTLRQLSQTLDLNLNMRIGINTGPVVAGVIGNTKFSYDLWGDAVNVASRMEHHAGENKILVSQYTFERLKDQFVFGNMMVLSVKGKGEVRAYELVGTNKQASLSESLS